MDIYGAIYILLVILFNFLWYRTNKDLYLKGITFNDAGASFLVYGYSIPIAAYGLIRLLL